MTSNELPLTRSPDDADVGAALPAMRIQATRTFVVSTAIATRDFQDVHHDRDAAHARGSTDIFVNILMTTGLVQRYVTEWAGPETLIRGISIRLGVPCYAGDTMVFSGRVSGRAAGNGAGAEVVVDVVADCALGEHMTGSVRLVLPDAATAPAQKEPR